MDIKPPADANNNQTPVESKPEMPETHDEQPTAPAPGSVTQPAAVEPVVPEPATEEPLPKADPSAPAATGGPTPVEAAPAAKGGSGSKIALIIIVTALISGLVAGLAVYAWQTNTKTAATTSTNQQITDLTAENAALKTQNETLTQQNAALKAAATKTPTPSPTPTPTATPKPTVSPAK